MASTDATAIPVKNQAYRVTFPILDADGDLVTAAAALDSEVSKDAGTFTDCTNEATEIATASGMYYLDLTATEMNADTVAIIVKTTTADAKTTPIVLYPRDTGDIKVQLEPITHTSAVIPTVTTLTGHTPQTGDNFARLGAPAGASVSADVSAVKADSAAVKVKTDFLPSATAGAAGGVFIAGANAATSVTTALTANITGNLSGSVGSVTGAVGSVTAGVTLAASAIQAIWDALTSALTTAGSIGKKLADWVIGTSQTGDSFARLGAPAGASVSADIATKATPAQVNTEVLDVLNVDTFAEPGQEAPGATVTLVKKIGYLYKFLRNRITQTATTLSIYNDDATTVAQKATVSDNGTTYDRGEIATGP